MGASDKLGVCMQSSGPTTRRRFSLQRYHVPACLPAPGFDRRFAWSLRLCIDAADATSRPSHTHAHDRHPPVDSVHTNSTQTHWYVYRPEYEVLLHQCSCGRVHPLGLSPFTYSSGCGGGRLKKSRANIIQQKWKFSRPALGLISAPNPGHPWYP